MKGIKEKNYCDKCKKMTWHRYIETKKTVKGYTKCQKCGSKRII